MLRYLVFGERNFFTYPDPGGKRFSWEIFILFKGKCWPETPDGRRIGNQNTNFWIHPANVDYHWRSNDMTCRRAAIHFSSMPETVEDLMPQNDSLGVTLTQEELKSAERLVAEIQPHYLAPTKISPLVFERNMIDLCLLAMKSLGTERMVSLDNSPYSRIERAIAFYMQNIRRNPKIDEIARAVNLSTSHLRRMFFLVRNMTPHHYFHSLRMKRVADHVSTTDDTLHEVARQYGFSDATDLCRAFKRFFDVSPHVWRKNIAVSHQASGDWQLSRYAAVWRDRLKSGR
jgi:AraC-like DNA-binding protein